MSNITVASWGRVENTALLEYVRDKHRCKIGVMIAFVEKNKVHIGWSKCRVKGKKEKRDRFDRDEGIDIAIKRARKYFDYLYIYFGVPTCIKDYKASKKTIACRIPHSMKYGFEDFVIKCIKYYSKDESNIKFPNFAKEAKLEVDQKGLQAF